MGMSVRYNISINQELIDLLHQVSKEQKIPVSKYIRIAVIEKLREHGKKVSDECTYWGARTDLPNRVTEEEKRRLRKERRAAKAAKAAAKAAVQPKRASAR